MHRLLLPIAAGLGLASAPAAAPAPAQAVTGQAVPESWRAYAERVTEKVTARLSDGQDPAALRLRAAMRTLPDRQGEASPGLVLRIWIDASGHITRVECPTFAAAPAGDDLRALLLGMALDQEPPANMRLPLRLSIQAIPLPDADIAPGGDRRKIATTMNVRSRAEF
ncbi:hypothetical protein [Sphingomonas sp. KR3-1]|uniref:hypothetical protein n=1 Tax=Sphingomonas sp. KR3-1 TaxID=3156611 RepID=UPI0032B5AE90